MIQNNLTSRANQIIRDKKLFPERMPMGHFILEKISESNDQFREGLYHSSLQWQTVNDHALETNAREGLPFYHVRDYVA